MHHGLSGLFTYGLKGHGKGDEHPVEGGAWHAVFFSTYSSIMIT